MENDLAKFLYEVGQLKRVKRSGWWIAGVENMVKCRCPQKRRVNTIEAHEFTRQRIRSKAPLAACLSSEDLGCCKMRSFGFLCNLGTVLKGRGMK